MLQREIRMLKPSHRNNGRWQPRCACQCRSSIRAEAEVQCQEPLGIGAKYSLGAHGEQASKNKKYSKSTRKYQGSGPAVAPKPGLRSRRNAVAQGKRGRLACRTAVNTDLLDGQEREYAQGKTIVKLKKLNTRKKYSGGAQAKPSLKATQR